VDHRHQSLAGEFIARLCSWAEEQADVRGVVLVGSQARADPGADEWSDVDVTVLTPSVLDAAITIPEVAEFRRRGFRILVDKDETISRAERAHAPLESPERGLPSAAEFEHATSDFWYHAVWAAKKLARGELWVATRSVNCYLGDLLLHALEWHARLVADRDTWHQGRFLEHWADQTAVTQLRHVFAPYDADGVQRALQASMELYRNLTIEIAQRLDCAYPADADRFASQCVAGLVPSRA
jgi:aminoglycoside 6-adenylyltransferase